MEHLSDKSNMYDILCLYKYSSILNLLFLHKIGYKGK